MRRRIAPVVSIVAILLVAGVAWLVGFGHRDRE
jgi:hypothetical protein